MDGNAQTPTQASAQNPELVQVDVRFLKVVLDYLKTKPYEEVWQMVDVLTGRAAADAKNQTTQPTVNS